MTKAITTIQFNTERKYTAEGQIITATLYADGTVTFMDHSRMIDGEFNNGMSALLAGDNYDHAAPRFDRELRAEVMVAYDGGKYQASRRSSHDGMIQGGRNTREAFELRAKLKALPTPEKFAAHGLEGLVTLWADFCGSFDLPRTEASEALAAVACKHGDAWRDVQAWIMDFIVEWEKLAEPKAGYRVDGDDAVELFSGHTQAECRSFVAGYTRSGDWGGHSALRLIDAATGEILHTYEAPEQDEEQEEAPEELGGLGVRTDKYPDHLDDDEREVIDALIRAALEQGYEVRVKGLTPFTTNYQLITEHVAATDEEHIQFRKVGDDMPAGWVFLVHGNAASEVIADATDNLLIGALLDVVQPIIDRLEAEGK